MIAQGELLLRLPAGAELVSVARLTVAGLASRLGFDFDEVEDLRVAVAEAVTLLLPPPAEEATATVELRATWSPEGLCVVAERQEGTPRQVADPDERAVAVMVMEALVDDVTLDGPIIRLRKQRRAT